MKVSPAVERRAQQLAVVICVGFGLAFAIANIRSWELEDMDAYWNAALRLQAGMPLYPPPAVEGAPDTYRYAPWLAWAWIPLTHLPKQVIQVAWSGFLLAAAAAAVVPIMRARSVAALCLVALMGGLLVKTASTGNIHALLVAALVHGIGRRSGPIWIGVTASVKIVPLAYVLVWFGRGEWLRGLVAIACAATLWAPALLYDLSAYPIEAGGSLSLLAQFGPVVWGAVVIALAVTTIALARSAYASLAAAATMVAAIPRLDLYDLTYLQTGAQPPRDRHGERRPGT